MGNNMPEMEWKVDHLQVRVYFGRREMGAAAAEAVAGRIREVLSRRPVTGMVFAAAPSQNEFLEVLCGAEGLDWSRVTAFHLDEYIGLPADAPQRFGNFLRDRLFDRVKPGRVYYLSDSGSPEEACQRYSALLAENPVDIACIGIGENGHIAFNDPPVADFADPRAVKVVKLEKRCREQQVHDGCFPSMDAVPTHALTMTIPAIMAARWIYCMVPGPTKQEAILHTLKDPISTACPASVLRRHKQACLYLDKAAAALVM